MNPYGRTKVCTEPFVTAYALATWRNSKDKEGTVNGYYTFTGFVEGSLMST